MLQSVMLSIASTEHETYKEIDPAGDEPTDTEFARATHAALPESIRATLEAIAEFEQTPYNEFQSALTESSGCQCRAEVSLEKVIHFPTLDQLPSDRVPLLYAVTN